MANAKDLKLRLRAHVEQRMRDFRELHARSSSDFYCDIAYGSVWSANVVDAISDQERDVFLAELSKSKAAVPA
jgi:hypothetical protein